MPDHQERRGEAIIAFLGAGLPQAPSRAQAVTALAEARRALAAHQARNEPVEIWLAEQVRHSGIRETSRSVTLWL